MAQRQFIIDGGFKTDDASELLANLTMGGSITPNVDSNGTTGYDLGSTSMKWRDLYLSQGSLYIDNQKVLESDSGTIVVQADADQGLTVKTLGTGVLTLQSATTVSMAGTLQMGAGKLVTDVSGVAVGFGDKIDLNSNRMINVGTPVDANDASSKSYVDQQVANLINGAPGALDTLNELANALGDDAAFSATVTANIATNAASIVSTNTTVATNTAQVAANLTAIATANTAIATKANTTYVDAQNTSNAIAWEGYADASETAAIATSAIDATAKADAAQAAAQSYTDTAITNNVDFTGYAQESYVDTAEADAVASAEAKDVARMVTSDAYADQAEADAITSAEAKDVVRAAAAALDATTKVDALETSLTHFHSAVTDITDASDTTYTFSELTNARHYAVFLNRMVLRANEYSVSGTTVTLVAGTHDVGDELEVTGFSS